MSDTTPPGRAAEGGAPEEPARVQPARVEPARAEPTARELFAQAAQRSGLGRVTPGEAPNGRALLGAIGGVRGLVESILPGLGFLVVYTITGELLPSVLAPLAVAVLFILVRVVSRQPVTSALAGAIGIGVSAVLALLSGRAEDNFVPGFFINAATLLVMLVSVAVRRPLIGVIVGLLLSDEHWRADRAKSRVALVATLLWAALAALRLAVQVPLWALAQTQALAATKLLMGVPLYAALLWVTWLLVRTAWRPRSDGADTPEIS